MKTKISNNVTVFEPDENGIPEVKLEICGECSADSDMVSFHANGQCPLECKSFLILNENEFVDNLYRRYDRMFLEGLIEAYEILRTTTSKTSATSILAHSISNKIHKVTSNSAELQSLYTRIFKRGNPRKRSKVGL